MKTILFDWNGTLLDDLAISMDSMNQVLKRRKMKIMQSVEEYRSIFGFPVKDYYEKLGFDFTKESFEAISVEFMDYYMSHYQSAKLAKEAEKLIFKLKQQGNRCVILSASRQSNLLNQTDYYQCTQWFDDVVGIDDIYAASKIEAAKNWIKNHCDENEELVFIGDTLHDKETAEAIGARCILVASGHQSRERLLKANVLVVDRLEELYSILVNS